MASSLRALLGSMVLVLMALPALAQERSTGERQALGELEELLGHSEQASCSSLALINSLQVADFVILRNDQSKNAKLDELCSIMLGSCSVEEQETYPFPPLKPALSNDPFAQANADLACLDRIGRLSMQLEAQAGSQTKERDKDGVRNSCMDQQVLQVSASELANRAATSYEQAATTALAAGQHEIAKRAWINAARGMTAAARLEGPACAGKEEPPEDLAVLPVSFSDGGPAGTAGRASAKQAFYAAILTPERLQAEAVPLLDQAASALATTTPSPAQLADRLGLLIARTEIAALVDRSGLLDLDPTLQQDALALGALGIAAETALRRAETLERMGRHREALRAARAAALHADGADAPDILERAQLFVVSLLDVEPRTKLDPASRQQLIQAYRAVLATLERRRMALLRYDWLTKRSPYREKIAPVVDRLTTLLTENATSTEHAEERNRIFREVLQVSETGRAVELSDYFRNDCVADLEARTRNVGEIDPRAAALYTIVRGNAVDLYLSLPDGTIEYSRGTLPSKGALNRFVSGLGRSRKPDWDKVMSRQLYDMLIRPFLRHLQQANIETIVYVPDGQLRNVPLAVLLDEDTPLLQQFAIVVQPGLQFVEAEGAGFSRQRLLLGAVSLQCEGFPLLPSTKIEAQGIAASYGRSDTVLRLDQEVTKTQLDEDITGGIFTSLHLATHALFEASADDSFILMGDCQPLRLNELERLIKRVKYRDHPLDLLVLSSCQSAVGDEQATLGLAGLAVKSGARSAIGSLWEVDDRAAAQVMTLFHEALANDGVEKAAALQAAALATRSIPGFELPKYWAPFQLVGDWR